MKKVTVLSLIVIFVALGIFIGYQYASNAANNPDNIVADNENNLEDEVVENPTVPVQNPEHVKTPDNITIYVGMQDEFKEFAFSMDSDLTVQQEANNLISEIGKIIGYKILVNDIANGTDGMTINFNSSSAPFNTIDSYVGDEKYTIADYSTIVYTIFDSIDKTLKGYFGNNLNIWFTLEDGEITIDDVVPTLHLTFSEPYQGSKNYLQ